jgi:hypothetical protein
MNPEPAPAKRTPFPVSESGATPLVSTVLLLVLLLSLGAGTLLMTSIDLQSTSHYRSGRQAFFAAESGILHALSTINGRGVIDFQTDIVEATQWNRLYGASTKALASDPSITYEVVVAADPADPLNRGSITATGFAELEAQSVISIAIQKGIRAGPGALYLAADEVNPDFGARDQFLIDGNDYTLEGNVNPTGPTRPGIATRNDGVTQEAIRELSAPQKMRVQGLGFSLDPLTPSVKTIQGPDVTDLEQIVSHLLSNNPGVQTVSDRVLTAGEYGTLEAPQITHLTNKNVTLKRQPEGSWRHHRRRVVHDQR